MKTACYTSPLRNMPSSIRLIRRKLFCGTLALILSSFAMGQDANPNSIWNDTAAAFVREVLSQAGSPSSVSVTVKNKSSISDNDVSQINRALETQFRAAKIRIVTPETALATMKIVLSENSSGYIWVGEIEQGLTRLVVLMPVEKKALAVSTNRTPTLVLQKSLVLSAVQPILDFAQTDASHWIVLTSEGVAFVSADWLRQSTGSPQLQNVNIVHSQPWPRDLRGHILLGPSATFDIFLPGTRCGGNTSMTNAISCHESDDPWPLSPPTQQPLNGFFSGTRNFYTGALVGSGSYPVPPFFSAASFGEGSGRLWIFAQTDGRARVYNRLNAAPLKIVNGWGSDLASLRSTCGFGWQLLAVTTGDANHADSLQAFEIVNKDAVPVTAPLELSGPVVALWSASDSSMVNAVVRNLTSKTYEALTLSISCNK